MSTEHMKLFSCRIEPDQIFVQVSRVGEEWVAHSELPTVDGIRASSLKQMSELLEKEVPSSLALYRLLGAKATLVPQRRSGADRE